MKVFKTVLKIIAVAAIAALMLIAGIEDGGKRVFIGKYTRDHISIALYCIAWVCNGILLAMFLKKKRSPDEQKRINPVLPIAAALAEAGLTVFIIVVSSFGDFREASRINSPDRDHYIVRIEDEDWFGNSKYKFYIKDSGVIYRYIFDAGKPLPELEWTDDGIIYNGDLYEY